MAQTIDSRHPCLMWCIVVYNFHLTRYLAASLRYLPRKQNSFYRHWADSSRVGRTSIFRPTQRITGGYDCSKLCRTGGFFPMGRFYRSVRCHKSPQRNDNGVHLCCLCLPYVHIKQRNPYFVTCNSCIPVFLTMKRKW